MAEFSPNNANEERLENLLQGVVKDFRIYTNYDSMRPEEQDSVNSNIKNLCEIYLEIVPNGRDEEVINGVSELLFALMNLKEIEIGNKPKTLH